MSDGCGRPPGSPGLPASPGVSVTRTAAGSSCWSASSFTAALLATMVAVPAALPSRPRLVSASEAAMIISVIGAVLIPAWLGLGTVPDAARPRRGVRLAAADAR